MIITRETKERFVKMLAAHEIIIIARTYGKGNGTENRIIGTHNGLKWDFTPLVNHCTGCKMSPMGCARGWADELIRLALVSTDFDGIKINNKLISHTRDYLTTFWM